MQWPAAVFVLLVAVQRLLELIIARRNTRHLLAAGAREFGAGHYPLIVALHASWLVALAVLGVRHSVVLDWLALYLALQPLRVWTMVSLGERWTTRVIVLDRPLLRRGPYRLLKHPNYLLVIAELAVAPMVLGLPEVALVFGFLNLLLLAVRVRVEEQGLSSLRNPAQ